MINIYKYNKYINTYNINITNVVIYKWDYWSFMNTNPFCKAVVLRWNVFLTLQRCFHSVRDVSVILTARSQQTDVFCLFSRLRGWPSFWHMSAMWPVEQVWTCKYTFTGVHPTVLLTPQTSALEKRTTKLPCNQTGQTIK